MLRPLVTNLLSPTFLQLETASMKGPEHAEERDPRNGGEKTSMAVVTHHTVERLIQLIRLSNSDQFTHPNVLQHVSRLCLQFPEPVPAVGLDVHHPASARLCVVFVVDISVCLGFGLFLSVPFQRISLVHPLTRNWTAWLMERHRWWGWTDGNDAECHPIFNCLISTTSGRLFNALS